MPQKFHRWHCDPRSSASTCQFVKLLRASQEIDKLPSDGLQTLLKGLCSWAWAIGSQDHFRGPASQLCCSCSWWDSHEACLGLALSRGGLKPLPGLVGINLHCPDRQVCALDLDWPPTPDILVQGIREGVGRVRRDDQSRVALCENANRSLLRIALSFCHRLQVSTVERSGRLGKCCGACLVAK